MAPEPPRTGVPASCAAGRAAASRTICAAGGINASLETPDPEDRMEIHAADTIREGHFVCNPRAPHQVSLRPDPKARTVGLRLRHARD